MRICEVVLLAGIEKGSSPVSALLKASVSERATTKGTQDGSLAIIPSSSTMNGIFFCYRSSTIVRDYISTKAKDIVVQDSQSLGGRADAASFQQTSWTELNGRIRRIL